jgi:hypothetical protein
VLPWLYSFILCFVMLNCSQINFHHIPPYLYLYVCIYIQMLLSLCSGRHTTSEPGRPWSARLTKSHDAAPYAPDAPYVLRAVLTSHVHGGHRAYSRPPAFTPAPAHVARQEVEVEATPAALRLRATPQSQRAKGRQQTIERRRHNNYNDTAILIHRCLPLPPWPRPLAAVPPAAYYLPPPA